MGLARGMRGVAISLLSVVQESRKARDGAVNLA